MAQADWDELTRLADGLKESTIGPGKILVTEWHQIEQAIVRLRQAQDWQGLIRLRLLFADICSRDTVSGSMSIRKLESAAIAAARSLDDTVHLARFLGDLGHNLHRQGFSHEAIAAFEESSHYYRQLGNHKYVLRNRHMMALCHRALGHWEQAYTITTAVLEELPVDDVWRGQPLQVLAWLYRDNGDLQSAEKHLTAAIQLQKQNDNPDILMAGSLADLGEILGLQRRYAEAENAFQESLAILEKHKGHYSRQEARTNLKLAEVLARQRQYQRAAQLLREADELCYLHGEYYDQLWKIALAEAALFFRMGKWHLAARKMRSCLRLRRRLGLSNRAFARQLLIRAWVQLVANRLARGWEYLAKYIRCRHHTNRRDQL